MSASQTGSDNCICGHSHGAHGYYASPTKCSYCKCGVFEMTRLESANQTEENQTMPLFEAAIVKRKTNENDAELVYGPTALIARNTQDAYNKALAQAVTEGAVSSTDDISVIVRSFQ